MATLHFRRVQRRRTARVSLFVNLSVSGDNAQGAPFQSRGRTESVSEHGGCMLLDVTVLVGQSLKVTNEFTRETEEVRVVDVRKDREDKQHVSFAFCGCERNFWRMTFPAAGARPLRRHLPTQVSA